MKDPVNIASLRLINQCIARTTFVHPAETVSWLGAVQAQDYQASLWAVGLRTQDATEATIERALADTTIVRTWPMRGTLHFVAASDVRWMLALLTPRVVAGSARRMQQLELDEAVVARSEEVFASALQGGEQRTREEMYQLLEGAGISPSGQRGYYLLWRAAQDGLICFGARSDKQQTFALLDEWVPPTRSLVRDEALAELALRYFTGHGPATLPDFVWWSGLTVSDARAGLEMARPRLARQVAADQTYWLAPSTPAAGGESRSAYLLPAFDEYLVGYKDRSAVLDPSYAKRAQPGGGMLSPTVVLDGQVVGSWKRTIRKDKIGIAAVSFTPWSPAAEHAFAAAAERYGRFVGMPAEASRTKLI